MDAWERQQVFREMAGQLMRNGPLSTSRRRRLVQYAAALDINATLAGRLIEQARKSHAEQADPPPRTLIVAPIARRRMPTARLIWTIGIAASMIAALAALSWNE